MLLKTKKEVFLMKNTNLLEAWTNASLVPIWVAIPSSKLGGKDIRALLALSVDEGDAKTFVLPNDTIRDLRDCHSFNILEACEVRDNTGCYECIKVVEFKPSRSKHPMLITKRIAA